MPKIKHINYTDHISWQIGWMDQYAKMRQELNERIEVEKYVNNEKRSRINDLQNRLTEEKNDTKVLMKKLQAENDAIRDKFANWKRENDVKYQKIKTKLAAKREIIIRLKEEKKKLMTTNRSTRGRKIRTEANCCIKCN